LTEELADRAGGQSSGFAREFVPVLNDDESGDCRNAELLGDARAIFSVHLGNEECAVGGGGDFGNFRRNHFARAAPGSPEVDENWQSRVGGERLKLVIARDVNRRARWRQFFMAPAAAEGLAEPFVTKTIAFAALRAGQNEPAFIEVSVCRSLCHRSHVPMYSHCVTPQSGKGNLSWEVMLSDRKELCVANQSVGEARPVTFSSYTIIRDSRMARSKLYVARGVT
jgi:hypothetical protein